MRIVYIFKIYTLENGAEVPHTPSVCHNLHYRKINNMLITRLYSQYLLMLVTMCMNDWLIEGMRA